MAPLVKIYVLNVEKDMRLVEVTRDSINMETQNYLHETSLKMEEKEKFMERWRNAHGIAPRDYIS